MTHQTFEDQQSLLRTSLDITLVLLIGLLIYAPLTDFFGPISQGDNGVDLYAAQAVLQGQRPYTDFSWSYGPLMPFYAALFFKIFGIGIKSLILARLAARLITGLLLYLTARTVLPRLWAMIATFWFWTFYSEFIHTINHTLGISALMMSACALFYYAKTKREHFLWIGLAGSFILAFIKLNFGLVGFLALAAGHLVITLNQDKTIAPRHVRFYLLALGAAPALTFGVYWLLLHSLPGYVIRQSLPYTNSFILEEIPLSRAVGEYFARMWSNFTTYPWHAAMGTLTALAAGRIVYLIKRKRWTPAFQQELLTTLSLIMIFVIAAMHEFIRNGTSYRAFWAKPLTVLLIFVLIHRAFPSEKIRRWLLVGLTLLILWGQAYGRNGLMNIKTPAFYLAGPRADVYVYNRRDWIRTVEETTAYLNDHLKADERFFALPHDELYYFLTGRLSPDRQLNFFAGGGITTEQERDVIASLERFRVRLIVMSNRAVSQELGYGVLGQDYCPLLKQYIDDHFETVAQFGEWTTESRWNWNHAVKILQRKTGG